MIHLVTFVGAGKTGLGTQVALKDMDKLDQYYVKTYREADYLKFISKATFLRYEDIDGKLFVSMPDCAFERVLTPIDPCFCEFCQ